MVFAIPVMTFPDYLFFWIPDVLTYVVEKLCSQINADLNTVLDTWSHRVPNDSLLNSLGVQMNFQRHEMKEIYRKFLTTL